jgi:hypothetical protein
VSSRREKMKVRHEGHSAAVCIPKEPGEISGRERGVPYVQGLGRNGRRASRREWPWRSPHLPFFCPRKPPWAGVDLSRT